MENELPLKNYAHIGDAVWEVFVRDFVIQKVTGSKMLHKLTTDRVNATFQKQMLEFISPELNEYEQELVRRARNLTIPIGRRCIQHDYRLATAFEVLIGYWYIHDKSRLQFFWDKFKSNEFFN